ncbi:RNA polymerase sigma-70 factor [uncultured Bacteroides sp.]|uniref:RNA polymerase sigma-70 factor n=1 Tax=uncultured Bacteroides sp. TaxID=162156 RepID=UPI00338EF748
MFHRYYPLLCAYARRFVGMDDAEEVVQDVFACFWEKRESLLINSSLNAYLFRMVYHRVLNKLAKDDAMHRADERFCQDMNDLLYDEEPFSLEELQQRIEAALASLPETYREAFMLYCMQGLECKEMAAQLGVSDKLVYYRVQQAVKLLEQSLKDYLPLALLMLSMNANHSHSL